MYPLDVDTRMLLAAERAEQLRRDARPALRRPQPKQVKRPVPQLRPAAGPNRLMA
jgi:hypothetical protein